LERIPGVTTPRSQRELHESTADLELRLSYLRGQRDQVEKEQHRLLLMQLELEQQIADTERLLPQRWQDAADLRAAQKYLGPDVVLAGD
jgi:hypothetical protein